MFCSTSEAKETVPSLLPAGTSYVGPLVCGLEKMLWCIRQCLYCSRQANISYLLVIKLLLTISKLSLAAKANISAHDTTPLHSVSSLVFASSMTSNPRRLGLFTGESFSAVFEEVESMRMDPSQPCREGEGEKRRS